MVAGDWSCNAAMMVTMYSATFRQKVLTPNFSKTFFVQIFVSSFFLHCFTIFRVSLEKWYFLGIKPNGNWDFRHHFINFLRLSNLQFFENMELMPFAWKQQFEVLMMLLLSLHLTNRVIGQVIIYTDVPSAIYLYTHRTNLTAATTSGTRPNRRGLLEPVKQRFTKVTLQII